MHLKLLLLVLHSPEMECKTIFAPCQYLKFSEQKKKEQTILRANLPHFPVIVRYSDQVLPPLSHFDFQLIGYLLPPVDFSLIEIGLGVGREIKITANYNAYQCGNHLLSIERFFFHCINRIFERIAKTIINSSNW